MRRTVWCGAALAALLVGGMLSSVHAAAPPTGKVAFTAEKWQAYLIPAVRGARVRVVRLKGGTEPVDVPAGKYRVRYMITAPPDSANPKARPATIMGTVKSPVTIEAGKTTKVEIGGAMEAVISARMAKGKMRISLSFKDAAGNKATVYASPGKAKRPAPPKVLIADSAGKTVYTATMKFG